MAKTYVIEIDAESPHEAFRLIAGLEQPIVKDDSGQQWEVDLETGKSEPYSVEGERISEHF